MCVYVSVCVCVDVCVSINSYESQAEKDWRNKIKVFSKEINQSIIHDHPGNSTLKQKLKGEENVLIFIFNKNVKKFMDFEFLFSIENYKKTIKF